MKSFPQEMPTPKDFMNFFTHTRTIIDFVSTMPSTKTPFASPLSAHCRNRRVAHFRRRPLSRRQLSVIIRHSPMSNSPMVRRRRVIQTGFTIYSRVINRTWAISATASSRDRYLYAKRMAMENMASRSIRTMKRQTLLAVTIAKS